MSTAIANVTPMSPHVLLQTAIEKNVDVAQLEKLIDLQARWDKMQAVRAYNVAMNECQKRMPVVVKDAANNQTSSRYAKLETIQEHCRPIYTDVGFSLTFGEEDCPREGWKRTYLEIRHVAGHVERMHIDLPLDGFTSKGNVIGAMNPVQAAVSTGSYAQRYLFCRAFNLTIANQDVDGNRPKATNGNGCITADQVKELRWLIQEAGGDEAKLCEWANIKSVELLPAAWYARVAARLKDKITEGVA